MDYQEEAAGMAALSICESLLLCLGDMGVLSDSEIRGLLLDAESAHAEAATITSGAEAARHRTAAQLIRDVLSSSKALRDR